jgi:hypothetical protein
LYWYCDEPELPYSDAADAERASAGAPKTPRGTSTQAETAAIAALRREKANFTIGTSGRDDVWAYIV